MKFLLLVLLLVLLSLASVNRCNAFLLPFDVRGSAHGVVSSAQAAQPAQFAISNVKWSNCDGRTWPLMVTAWSAQIMDGDVAVLVFHFHTSITLFGVAGLDNGTFAGMHTSHLDDMSTYLVQPYQMPILANQTFIASLAIAWPGMVGHWDGSAPGTHDAAQRAPPANERRLTRSMSPCCCALPPALRCSPASAAALPSRRSLCRPRLTHSLSVLSRVCCA